MFDTFYYSYWKSVGLAHGPFVKMLGMVGVFWWKGGGTDRIKVLNSYFFPSENHHFSRKPNWFLGGAGAFKTQNDHSEYRLFLSTV